MKRMPLSQSTVSVRDGVIYLADQSGLMHCLDAETGSTHWTHDMGHDVTCRSQMLADGKVYVSTDTREMFVFAASDEKKLLWQGKADDRPATVGVDEGTIILATPRSVTTYTSK
jgi:outer membrane protein assembly factor BamB